MHIQQLHSAQKAEALQLARRVFMEYVAPDYGAEGIRSFVDFLQNGTHHLMVFGAWEQDKLVGMIATRNESKHIALFFVDGQYHRQGIGKKLFETVLEHGTANEITVHASPYAVGIYHRLGFTDTDTEQLTDGIRYTPMVYQVSNSK